MPKPQGNYLRYVFNDYINLKDGTRRVELKYIKKFDAEKKAKLQRGFLTFLEIRDIVNALDLGELLAIEAINFSTGDLTLKIKY